MNKKGRVLAVLGLLGNLILAAAPAVSHADGRNETGTDVIGRGAQQNEVEGLLEAALAAYRQHRFDEALSSCAKASRLAPADYRPHYVAGYVYKAQRKDKSASEEFGTAILLQPRNKELYLLKATVDSERGAKYQAIAACRKALEIDPSYAEAYATMGQALRYEEKRRGEAITAYESAIMANPNLLVSYEPLGELFSRAGDQKNAEETFKKGLAADPKHMTGRFALGRLLIKQGRLKEARDLWNGRTADDNTIPSLAVLLERAEKLKQATDVLALKPNDPDTLVEMGLAVMDGDSWVVDGRQERAIVYFKKALELRPGFVRAQYNICKGYIQISDINRDKKRIVDEELNKLRLLDTALAKELEEYRKSYVGGIGGVPVDFNK